MKILVLGATGWIGRAVANALAEHGFAHHIATPRVDILDRDDVSRTIGATSPSLVFNCVGGIAGRMPDERLEAVHVAGTRNLVAALAAVAPRAHLVGLGSAAEYGFAAPGQQLSESDRCAPVSRYGAIKVSQTQVMLDAAASGQPITLLRLFNLIGPGATPGLFLPDLFARLRAARASGLSLIDVREPGSIRDFVPLSVVAEVAVELARDPRPRGLVNVASGVGTRIGEVVEWLREISDFAWTSRPLGGESTWSIGSIGRMREEFGDLEITAARTMIVDLFRSEVRSEGIRV